MPGLSAGEAMRKGGGEWAQYIKDSNLPNEFVAENLDFTDAKPWDNSGHNFPRKVTFRNCRFRGWHFGQSTFSDGAEFEGCVFAASKRSLIYAQGMQGATLRFLGCSFEHKVLFSFPEASVTITRCDLLGGIEIAGELARSFLLSNSTIVGVLAAPRAIFKRPAFFIGLSLKSPATQDAYIPPVLDFRGATFSSDVGFDDTIFAGVAHFDHAIFESKVDFQGAVFLEPPIFSGAKLNAVTLFNRPDNFNKQFPNVGSEHARESYRALKAHMAGLQAIGEQLGFYRLEMRAEQAHAGRMTLIFWYGLLSDYGLSWMRPLAGLLITICTFSLIFGANLAGKLEDSWDEAIAFSIHNAFPFLGAVKNVGIDWSQTFVHPLFVAGCALAQNLVSGLFLFLLALAVRNRLRMKS